MPTLETIPFLKAALEATNVEALRKFLLLMTGQAGKGVKVQLVNQCLAFMQDETTLKKMWARMDLLQQAAVAETVHGTTPHYDSGRFKAKYGQLPKWGDVTSYKPNPNELNLFFYSSTMPLDLKGRLESFVPVPKKVELSVSHEIPELFDGEAIIVVATEACALHDLPSLLGLIEAGKISVTEANRFPTATGMRAVASLLFGGDFYDEASSTGHYDKIGDIKAFAWPMIMQASGLATLSGNRLQLSKEGESLLGQSSEKSIRLAWKRWQGNKLLDEFRRIDTIKGQTGKGKTGFTALAGRRAPIQEALKACPVGQWVDVDHFFRFMRASDLDFEIHRNPWNLYIAEAQYGSLGYDGFHKWEMLQGRYIMCLLFEYAATLGMIDVAYVAPYDVQNDYKDNWGTDDMEFLSRYDGLLYFRLNPLGAYCLGLTDKYDPPLLEKKESLKVLPNLDLVAMADILSPGDLFVLDTYTVKVSDVVWRMDQEKFIEVIENGHQLDKFIQWLKARSDQELPNTVQQFLADIEKRTTSLRLLGMAKWIQCADPALAALIANDSKTGKLCILAGTSNLVVPEEMETRFRAAVRKMGYCLSKAGK